MASVHTRGDLSVDSLWQIAIGQNEVAVCPPALDTRELSLGSTRVSGRASFQFSQLYMRMAEDIREGKSVSSDFDAAVKRHQLRDAIQKASDTGIRQIL